MRIASVVLMVCTLFPGCADSDHASASTSVQDVGLQAASGSAAPLPSLGEGYAPVIGSPGDGAATVTQVGGWSGGPGAVTWHGGQWVMPVAAAPGAIVKNVACDVQPNGTSTDLMELVGENGVIGSTTVPAVTGVTIRSWIIPTSGYTVGDGEHLVIRHSPHDSTTGAWTTAGQDLTIISCAIAATKPTIITIPLAVTGPATGTSGTMIAPFATTAAGQLNAMYNAGFSVPVGSHIVSISASVQDNAGCKLAATLGHAGATGAGLWTLGTSSDGSGNVQTIQSPTMDVVTLPTEAYYAVLRTVAGTSACSVFWASVAFNAPQS